jgi:EAL domain-containing protein (putative c-di-GMP-specific phosphodiesterase class I)
MRDGHLSLFYQPKVELASGRVIAVEALARWSHPRRGLILPDEFIPQIETSRLAGPFNRWVLGRAIEQASAWRQLGVPLPVAVNLSPEVLEDVSLTENVWRLMNLWEVPGESLWIEVTERAEWEATGRAGETLEQLGATGIVLALDDFGVGHSSMARLVQVPMDVVKIDRTFVTPMAADPRHSLVVQAAIEIAHGLGLKVVAEGVETKEVWDRLRELGCDWAQGFLVSRPLPAEQLSEHIAQFPEAVSASLRARAAWFGPERRAQTRENRAIRSLIDRMDWVSDAEPHQRGPEVRRLAAVTAGEARFALRRR